MRRGGEKMGEDKERRVEESKEDFRKKQDKERRGDKGKKEEDRRVER